MHTVDTDVSDTLGALIHPGRRSTRLAAGLPRVGDLPIDVSAAVQRVPDASPAGSVALHWVFRLADDHLADRRD